ncbi:MAG: hypothetical protein ACP5OG_04170 [Candidatus Nanoarchaeia archaeon]
MTKRLHSIVLTTAIGLGALGLNGCCKCRSNPCEEQIYYKNKEILKNNLKDMNLLLDINGSWKMYFKGDFDFNKTLLFPQIMSGKGSIIANINDKDKINLFLSYSGDMEKIKLYNETKDPVYLNDFNLLSSLELKDNSINRFIIIAKGKEVTTYAKKQNNWYKNNSNIKEVEDYFDFNSINDKNVLGKKIKDSCVKKYVDLCDEMEKTFFE